MSENGLRYTPLPSFLNKSRFKIEWLSFTREGRAFNLVLKSILRVVKEEAAAGAAVFKQKWECWEGREEPGKEWQTRCGAGSRLYRV